MNERYDRMVTAGGPPVADATYRAAGSATPDDQEPPSEELAVDAALKVFKAAIDKEITDRLSGDSALTERLNWVRQGGRGRLSAAPAPNDEVVGYAYSCVLLWMRLVQSDEQSPVGLAERDLEEIAKETVARALNLGFDVLTVPDEAEQKAELLLRCIDRLPAAYKAWRLRSSVLDIAEFDESVEIGEGFVDSLRLYAADPDRATRLLWKWADAGTDVVELVADTQRALRRHGAMS